MDQDDEDKQPPRPKRRPSAPDRGTRKRSGGRTGADASTSKKSTGTGASMGKARAKASAGKSASAAGAKARRSRAAKKSTAADVSAEKSGEPRIRPDADSRLSRSLEYGVAILESFSAGRQTLGIADIADIVGVTRSTTHRYAMTLVALGYLEQNSKRKYRLARHAADPGGAAVGTIRRELAARAVLEELREQTGHTVSMGVLDGARVVYVHRLLAHGAGQYSADHDLGVGAGIPAYCSALGKVLLASISDAERRELLATIEFEPHGPNTIEERNELAAELDRISTRGVVVSDEELFAGSRSIAALVPRPRSEHPAAIEVTVPSFVYTVEQLRKRVGPRLKRAVKLISED
ncbi:MAG TPA: IclR family transcriptional regulator [Solirubrobacteraceae bacterium]|jgi:IclR family pca regulon transcriptional regulator|nr:IclR family transcriptional regulator [Solirubrobacteraceae bacterium]